MGGENLSQAELAEPVRQVEAAAGQAAGLGRGCERHDPASRALGLSLRRADRAGRATALELLHRNAVRDFATALTVLRGTTVKARASRSDAGRLRRIGARLERPTCLSLLKADGLAATGALKSAPPWFFRSSIVCSAAVMIPRHRRRNR